ncbi:transcriptional regulator protein-like protein [Anaeromyxobacter dehalogenans 2CP-1]|uniref:Transcriptional regulator protein-like protein n=1 Tax=Anaeromyxobacter dehalogenans (strain ATCC BAA-258 / DSM 21875 / 2CP-1) TaxID=455488 RepID=B8J9J5_ANAD2|nr:WYL domain-containing protein [Anaeromyxobacter dehalogenans]ACL67383.1 transcriptional regulator protein-like protein [Anaeromyxobacter dehalogenans 2CP-1]
MPAASTPRLIRTLGHALVRGRSARIRVADGLPAGAAPHGPVDVLALAFDGAWRVAARERPATLRVLALDRIAAARATCRRAGPPPPDFDPLDFTRCAWLDGSGPARTVTVRLPAALAPLAPALLPGARCVPGSGDGAVLCHVRTSRPDLLSALTASLGAGPALDCESMPTATTRPPAARTSAQARLLGLATFILAQPGPVSRRRIYEAFPDDYAGSADAKEKKFSRDKRDLERLGFVLDREDVPGGDDQVGYFIDPRASALPPLELAPEEAAVVWTAGVSALRASDHPLRDELESALRKLLVGAKGLPPRAAAVEELAADGAPASGALLDKLVDAWERRRTVTLEYLRIATGEVVRRDVDVYGWGRRRGEWIFAGHCHLRDAERVFYLSRVRALKVNARRRDPYRIPATFDVRRWTRQQIWDYDVHPPREAVIRFRGSLARVAGQLLPAARLRPDAEGGRVARLEVRNLRGLVRQALAWGPEAELLEPAEGRAMAREMLATLAAALDGRSP